MFEAACAGDIYVTPYDLEDDPVQILLACRANKKLPLKLQPVIVTNDTFQDWYNYDIAKQKKHLISEQCW